MTATYDENLPAALDRMRLQLGDTEVDPEENALIPDETYLATLDRMVELEATAYLAESLATRFGQETGSVRLPSGLQVAWPDRVKTWLELAARLSARLTVTTAQATLATRQPKMGVMATTATVNAPTGWPDANSLDYMGSPYSSSQGVGRRVRGRGI